MSALHQLRSKPKLWASAALLAIGVTSGTILGTTVGASASTTSSTTSNSGSSATPPAPTYRGLPESGTVTAVGSNTVTIDGKTYAVTSNSDIDKNGEATLSSLAVGDKVTFNTVASASTPTIDKLHAGNESLDRPSGPPMGGPQGGAPQPSAGGVG
jgi:hypothetical protein